MTQPAEVIVAALPRERARVASDLVALTKPRVVLMVLITTAVGYYVGLTGGPDYGRLVALLLGTALAAGGTLALNQYWERDVDALMARTRTRPLPEGRLTPLEALLFGAALTAGGLGVLALGAGWLAALTVAATFVLYVFAYTPLKLRTAFCTRAGRRRARTSASAPGRSSASSSCGSSRTRWPSPSSIAKTTRAPACACCR